MNAEALLKAAHVCERVATDFFDLLVEKDKAYAAGTACAHAAAMLARVARSQRDQPGDWYEALANTAATWGEGFPPSETELRQQLGSPPANDAVGLSERRDDAILLDLAVVAYHEAGHAAIGFYFGEDVEVVSIVPDGDGRSAGHSLTDRSDHDALQYEDETRKQVVFERAAMSAMAGWTAQRRYAPDSMDGDQFAGDRHLVHEYLHLLDTPNQEVRDAYWRLLELRTAALVDQLWPEIERVAAALLEHKTLTPEQLRAAFVDPVVAGTE